MLKVNPFEKIGVQILLAAAIIVSGGALPIRASAQLCGGNLSSMCFDSELAAKSVSEAPPQDQVAPVRHQVTAVPRTPRKRPKKTANFVRSRDLRERTTVANASVDSISTCLSLKQVHGGHPMYHVIGGRRCWFASTRGPQKSNVR